MDIFGSSLLVPLKSVNDCRHTAALCLPARVCGLEVNAAVDSRDARFRGEGGDARERSRSKAVRIAGVIDERDVLAEEHLEHGRRGRR